MDFSPLVGMAAQGVSEGVNSLIGEHNLSVKTKYQKHLMDYQMQQQRQMMLDEMSLRKQSYRNAGLSTAALAGSFGGNVAMPNASAGELSTVGKGMNPMEAFTMMANIKNIEADTKVKEADAANRQADTDLKNSQTDLNNWQLLFNQTYGAREAKAAIDKMDAETKNQLAQASKADQDKLNSILTTNAQVALLWQQYHFNAERFPVELQLMGAQIAELVSRGQLNRAQASAAYKSIEVMDSQIKLNAANAGLSKAQAGAATQLAALYVQQKGLVEVQKNKEQIALEASQKLGVGYYAMTEVIGTFLGHCQQITSTVGNLLPFTNPTVTTTTRGVDSRGNNYSSTSVTTRQ